MKIDRFFKDRLVAYAVLMQPLLIVIQHLLISVFGMSEESSTKYRVLMTALPMMLAIFVCIKRRPKLFVVSYAIMAILCIVSALFYSGNEPFIREEAIRFTFPIVIPSVLCLYAIGNINLIESCLLRISWGVVFLTILYAFNLLRGRFLFEGYNMSMSYALLLPALSLYANKRFISLVASFFLALMIIAIGSRGGFAIFGLYVLYDVLANNKKLIVPFAICVVLLLSVAQFMEEYLSEMGIDSRTIGLLLSGEITKTSGREGLYEITVDAIKQHSLFGLGLWGDRKYLNGHYCHNVLLEVCADFGLLLGPLLLVTGAALVCAALASVHGKQRAILVKYICAGLLPLMVSHSYLCSDSFGVFCGIVAVYYQSGYVRFKRKNRREKKTLSYV